MKHLSCLAGILLLFEGALTAQVKLRAHGGNEDAYTEINRISGGTAYEVPDCMHPVNHITKQCRTPPGLQRKLG